MQRRSFLIAAAGATAMRSFGAESKVPVTVIGLGGRGNDHMNFLAKAPEANIVGVCDVNQAAREKAVALVERLTGSKPKAYNDMRRVFEDRDVAAVTMATPNHWHALGAIWGCQAGKDVYVEKPACHNVFEGRKMIEAAAKYNRIVQVGSQGRSLEFRRQAIAELHGGVLGKLYMAKGLCFKRRVSIGKAATEPVPLGIDWDTFLGPAPMRPFTWNRFRYNWHWFWDTGNGDIGNQGAHEMDFARWAMGKDLPTTVVSTGGKYAYDDEQETPNTQLATYSYGDSEIVFEVRGLPTQPEENVMVGDLVYGVDGMMAVDATGYRIYRPDANAPGKMVLEKTVAAPPSGGGDTVPHFSNFLQAVQSRRKEDLHVPVEEGVKSATLCHLANASYRVGRSLKFDPAAWTHPGDAEANALLTRKYRVPYVVPQKV